VERSKADINYEDLQRQIDVSLRKEASLGPHGGYPWREENIFGPQVPEVGAKPWEGIPDYAWILVVIFGLFTLVLWIAFFLL
jgi:hypothetical protein